MTAQTAPSKGLNIALWVVQVLLCVALAGGGIWKLATPLAELSTKIVWAQESPTLLRFTAVVDLLGGLGVLLPSLTRIKPRLTVLAALGCVALMVSAIIF